MNESIKGHCVKLYNRLKDESVLDESTGAVIWKGALSRVSSDVGIPTGYYGRVTRQLVYMGCMTRIRRGSGNITTELQLHRSPEQIAEWQEAPKFDLTAASESAMLRQKIEDLDRLIGGIDIAQAFRDITEEIKQLRQDFKQHVQDTNPTATVNEGENRNG